TNAPRYLPERRLVPVNLMNAFVESRDWIRIRGVWAALGSDRGTSQRVQVSLLAPFVFGSQSATIFVRSNGRLNPTTTARMSNATGRNTSSTNRSTARTSA